MKKILYSILFILLLVIGYFAYSILNPVSPLKISEYNYNEKNVASITYSSPSMKDRLIFGSNDEGALVPFDEYWRTGANRHTFIENNVPLVFNGNELNLVNIQYILFHQKILGIFILTRKLIF